MSRILVREELISCSRVQFTFPVLIDNSTFIKYDFYLVAAVYCGVIFDVSDEIKSCLRNGQLVDVSTGEISM